MSSNGKKSKSPAPAARANKSSRAQEKTFSQSKTGPLGGKNDKSPPDHQSDISNNSEQLSTKNGSLAGHKRTSQQIDSGVPLTGSDNKSTTESHGKTRSGDTSPLQPKSSTPQKSGVTSHPHQDTFQVTLFPGLKKVPDSTPKSGVNPPTQPKETPQKSGYTSQAQQKATQSRVTSHPHKEAFKVELFPAPEETTSALKTENTEKKQPSSSVKPKKDEKQTSSPARGLFAPK